MSKIAHTAGTGKGREIARREWEAFCLQFTQNHQEWLVDVATHDESSRKASDETHGLPFEALILHLDHTDQVLSIMVRKSDASEEHVYRSIPTPHRMMIEDEVAGVRLHIESTNGTMTIIRFTRVASPDYDAARTHGIPSDRGK